MKNNYLDDTDLIKANLHIQNVTENHDTLEKLIHENEDFLNEKVAIEITNEKLTEDKSIFEKYQ